VACPARLLRCWPEKTYVANHPPVPARFQEPTAPVSGSLISIPKHFTRVRRICARCYRGSGFVCSHRTPPSAKPSPSAPGAWQRQQPKDVNVSLQNNPVQARKPRPLFIHPGAAVQAPGGDFLERKVSNINGTDPLTGERYGSRLWIVFRPMCVDRLTLQPIGDGGDEVFDAHQESRHCRFEEKTTGAFSNSPCPERAEPDDP
jgi:hypothetical protein